MSAETKRPPPPDYDPNPEWTEADFARARPPEEMPPEMLAQFPATMRRLRGPQKAPTKVDVHIKLSRDVVERFKAGGPGWQGRIDQALRRAIGLETSA